MKFKRFNPFTLNVRSSKKVKYIVMMGDSLSDRGTLNEKKLFGIIPMSYLTGLKGTSPKGRFTNGNVWSDNITAEIASTFTIQRLLEKKHLKPTNGSTAAQTTDDISIQGYEPGRHNIYLDALDISDAVVMRDKRALEVIHNSYTLDDDQFVRYHGAVWIRSYCEGGLSAHDYSWNFTFRIVLFFTRLIVSTLAHIREQLLNYDKKNQVSSQQKAETLVIEWSGANDLVTVNAKPSFEAADKAIAARINNIKKLIASGYRNFILFNLPNLALTPRFQALSKDEQEHAKKCVDYFNAQLQKACAELSHDYPHCSADAFDINTMFEHIYNNPEKFGFDADKLKKPYTESKDFTAPKNGLSPATGYMFYDDLHPSADMHKRLSAYFLDQLERLYKLVEPDQPKIERNCDLSEADLLRAFRKQYEERFAADKRDSFFSSPRSGLNCKTADLSTVLYHALHGKGYRTLDTLKAMGWFNPEGKLILDEPVLRNAMLRTDNMKKTHESLDALSARI